MRFNLTLFLLFFLQLVVWGQEESVWILPNKGQWDNRIQYLVKANGGSVIVEPKGLTYLFNDAGHNHADGQPHQEDETVHFHAVKTSYPLADELATVEEGTPSSFYYNYFLGNDPSKWQSYVRNFQLVTYKNYFPGVDYILKTENQHLEYQFLVHPGASISSIRRTFEGADKVKLDKQGNLIISTSLGEVKESKPIAFEIDETERREIRCEFRLQGGILQFHFPDGYDQSKTLLIDPSLTFSSFTGSIADNWGMTAAPGPNGETIGGGIVFGVGYPITTGAYDASFNGGEANSVSGGWDIGISKFSANGSQLLFSTYVGGNRNELPQSLVSTVNGDIYVLGITSSATFPTTAGAYDAFYGGGQAQTASGLQFTGTDIVVFKLSVGGNQLLASTFVGGDSNDGMNVGILQYNYGDGFRGDIILDGDNNVYVASNSRSINFPITTGSGLLGPQDAVVFKMSSDLNAIIWSRFLGGDGLECANSLILSNEGRLYVAGGTSSNNFAGLSNSNSGAQDGFLLELNPTTGGFVRGIYVGTSSYDQVYFVQTDLQNKVYVFGQSAGQMPITPGKYNNPGGGQFIQKYSDQLVLEWSTRIGGVNQAPQISPTAFLISDCYDIFFSGWGGQVNLSSMATSSTTNNFPITADAFQSVTNGSNFYLGILSQDANSLIYGTYMGGNNSSSNHVDGGTSRFDKSGAVYHAVCAACAGNDYGFTTTSGAFSTSNPSPNCNMAVFKFQLGLPYSLSPNQDVCEGGTYQLSASGGTSYTWSPSTGLNNPNIANPIASPAQTTVYYVTMDFNEGCSIVDSVIVTVIRPPVVDLASDITICHNTSTVLTAAGGDEYEWSPNVHISATNVQSVTVDPPQSMYYYVDVSNECFTTRDSIWVNVRPIPEILLVEDTLICRGTDIDLTPLGMDNITWQSHATLTPLPENRARVRPVVEQFYYVTGVDEFGCQNRDSVRITFIPIPPYTITPDTSICDGSSVDLLVTGDMNAIWQANAYTPTLDQQGITVSPIQNTTFYVDLEYESCVLRDSVRVNIIYLPSPILPDSLNICEGVDYTINASGADAYAWSPNDQLNQAEGASVIFNGFNDQNIVVTFTNICGTVYRTIHIDVINPVVFAFGDTIICPGESAMIYAEGAVSYQWRPVSGLNTPNASSVIASPSQNTNYVVYGSDQYGCVATDTVTVNLFPMPFVYAGTDYHVLQGETVHLVAVTNGEGVVSWSPTEYLSCIDCISTIATPEREMAYTATFIDTNGCVAQDVVNITFPPLVYIPNTFTPDGDELNHYFRVIAGNITSMRLQIFNRWGELIFVTEDVNSGWDGTYNGEMCPDGTYTWKLDYSDLRKNPFQSVGHINLLR